MEQVVGFEPACPAWRAGVLTPIRYLQKTGEPLLARHNVRLVGRRPRNIIFTSPDNPANLFADDAEESEKALGRWLPSIHF